MKQKQTLEETLPAAEPRPVWKTGTSHPLEAVESMNKLEADGYEVRYVFPVSFEDITWIYVAARRRDPVHA